MGVCFTAGVVVWMCVSEQVLWYSCVFQSRCCGMAMYFRAGVVVWCVYFRADIVV